MIDYIVAMNKLKEATLMNCQREEIPIMQALGRICAEKIVSNMNVPYFERSAMDGYAFSICDFKSGCKKFTVQEAIMAGDNPKSSYKKNTCVRVMTGAVIPKGFDAVVKQEDVVDEGGAILPLKTPDAGDNIVKIGEDFLQGDVLVNEGERIQPAHIGLLATIGKDTISVKKNPEIYLVSTGSELIAPGTTLTPGKIYNSSVYTMGGILGKYHLPVKDICTVGDDFEEMKVLFDQLADKADLVITTGGVSVGVKDLIDPVLKELGADQIFDCVNIKPGTPVKAYRYKNAVFLCCSGNPFAAYVNFSVFIWPVLEKYFDSPFFRWRESRLYMAEEYKKESKLFRFLRAKVEGSEVYIQPKNYSSNIFTLIEYDSLVLIPPHTTLDKKTPVTVYRMPPL